MGKILTAIWFNKRIKCEGAISDMDFEKIKIHWTIKRKKEKGHTMALRESSVIGGLCKVCAKKRINGYSFTVVTIQLKFNPMVQIAQLLWLFSFPLQWKSWDWLGILPRGNLMSNDFKDILFLEASGSKNVLLVCTNWIY